MQDQFFLRVLEGFLEKGKDNRLWSKEFGWGIQTDGRICNW